MICEYTSEYFNETLELYTALYSYHKVLFGGQPLSPNDLIEDFKKVVENPNNKIFLYRNDSKVLGFARLFDADGCYFLKELYVQRVYRNKGIGKKLLQFCEDFAQKHGEEQIYLSVIPINEIAVNFYRKNGYNVINSIELTKPTINETFQEVEFNGKKYKIRV